MATPALKTPGEALIVVGAERGHLGQSLYMEVLLGRREGAPPPVDLDAERRAGDLVRGLIRAGRVSAVHDVSDGGLLVAVAEMAFAGRTGVVLEALPSQLPAHALMFGEDQGRYVIAAPEGDAAAILAEARSAGLDARRIGTTGGDALVIAGEPALPLADLIHLQEVWLPNYMGAS